MINIVQDIILNRNAFLSDTKKNNVVTTNKSEDIFYNQPSNTISRDLDIDMMEEDGFSTTQPTKVDASINGLEVSNITTLSDVLEFHTRRFSGGEVSL